MAQYYPYMYVLPAHQVIVHEREFKLFQEWLADRPGYYTVVRDLDLKRGWIINRFYFDDPNTAFEFKLRWV